MDYLYLLLNLGSMSIPFLFSFHPKLKFYKSWGYLFPALFITCIIFIIWDILFTKYGIWGFNEDYFLNSRLFGLPIEEWLFFICIPYACIFMHYALLIYLPNLKISIKSAQLISYISIVFLLIIGLISYNKWYTFVNFMYASIILFVVVKTHIHILQAYFLSFLVMLIPFFVVNGILTGSFITNEVVWYNNDENLNIRLFTIPIEDTIYAFSLILTSLYLMSLFKRKLI